MNSQSYGCQRKLFKHVNIYSDKIKLTGVIDCFIRYMPEKYSNENSLYYCNKPSALSTLLTTLMLKTMLAYNQQVPCIFKEKGMFVQV